MGGLKMSTDTLTPYKKKVDTIIQRIYQSFNYTLDNEVREVLLDDAQYKLISAPAGGTKTTLTQLMIALRKLDVLVEGSRHNSKVTSRVDRAPTTIFKNKLLCLVYNKHNTEDISHVHAKFYNELLAQKFISASPSAAHFVEPGILATTLHSYALTIIEENLQLLKLRSFKIADEKLLRLNFQKIVEKALESSSFKNKLNPMAINDTKTLYDLYVGLELYLTPKDKPLTDNPQFELALQGTNVPSKYLREIFETYDKRKKLLKLNEFSDILKIASGLLEIPSVQEQYSTYFDTIVADEVQDFTPLMFSILRKLVGKDTRFIAVGDSDQSIYGFMGAQPNVIENFNTIMGIEPKLFNLTVNRRCRVDTMPFALNVIESNKDRHQKEIKPNRLNGTLERLEYTTISDQLGIIEKQLYKNMGGSTAILFRNKNQSILLSRYLYMKGIEVNYINASHCMEHRYYSMLLELIRECFIHRTNKGLSLLYRLMPFKKADLEMFLEIDPKTGLSNKCKTSETWGSIDFSPLYVGSKNEFSIAEQVSFLQNIAIQSSSIIASDCIEGISDLFYKNFFAYLSEAKDDEHLDNVRSWVVSDLSVGFSLSGALEQLYKRIGKLMHTSRTNKGKLNICTIHGTKGLEFNHVILNLESEKAVPHYLSPEAIKLRNEEENRLYYVGSTRQIDSLTVLCNQVNPHRLQSESFFETRQSAVIEAKYDNVIPSTLKDDLPLTTRTRSRGRKSLILGGTK